MTAQQQIVYGCLQHFTREELRDTAKALCVPRGRDKKDTLSLLCGAMTEGKAGVTVEITIREPISEGHAFPITNKTISF